MKTPEEYKKWLDAVQEKIRTARSEGLSAPDLSWYSGQCSRLVLDLYEDYKASRRECEELKEFVKSVYEYRDEEGELVFGLIDYYQMEDLLGINQEARER